VVCALAPWFLGEPLLLRLTAVLAAVVGVAASVTLRRWDAAAGLSVAELKRARASAEWQHEERVAELEGDLEEGRELRMKLEQRLRSKRAELAALRNEHASLLRRYATAETERASALEGRRLLEIGAKDPVPALPPVRETPALGPAPEPEPATPFSPAGGELFRQANEALVALETRSAADADPDAGAGFAETGQGEGVDAGHVDPEHVDGAGAGLDGAAGLDGVSVQEEPHRPAGADDLAEVDLDAADELDGAAPAAADVRLDTADEDLADVAAAGDFPEDVVEEPLDPSVPGVPAADEPGTRGAESETDGSTASGPVTATPVRPASGHFTVPTAVAVVPESPAQRRPGAEGGFDFFGTQRTDRSTEHGPQQAPAPAPPSAVAQQPAAPRAGAEQQTARGPAQPLIRTAPRADVGRVIDVDADDDGGLHAAS
jgi:hypothetical protein